MIEFKNVNFSYGKKKIFKDFNFNITDGERICLFAPSGYGKTTLLRLIMGLEKPTTGEITGTENKRFSVVFQEDRLLPHKTVLENILLFGDKKNALSILESLGLKDSANLYPHELSGGMARRVAIARALNRESDIYIFDEPFNGIDKENLEKTEKIINELTKDKIFIAVSHNPTEAELLNTRIVKI